MILEFTDDAIADRNDIYNTIFSETSKAADAHDDRIWNALNELVVFPYMGRIGRLPGTRELPISGTQVVVMYSVQPDKVLIHRILHGKRLWPNRVSL